MKRKIVYTLILMTVMLLSACNQKKKLDLNDESVVEIYYMDTKTSAIKSEAYQLISTDKEEQISELLYMLKKGPENLVYKSVLPEKVTVKEYYFNDDKSLTINFDEAYNELTGAPEVLCRAAIVKTLSQIQGVEYIQFNVNGQLLQDSYGNFVGNMTNEDFITNTEAGTKKKVKLYFANEDGDALVEHDTEINYSGTGSIEELVIKQLINGSTKLGMKDTIPEGTILLNVWKQEGICYVDFNEKFLDKLPNINEDVAIYSVVNTLVELSGISKVQFLINNTTVNTYWEKTPFNSSFERNLNLIKESN